MNINLSFKTLMIGAALLIGGSMVNPSHAGVTPIEHMRIDVINNADKGDTKIGLPSVYPTCTINNYVCTSPSSQPTFTFKENPQTWSLYPNECKDNVTNMGTLVCYYDDGTGKQLAKSNGPKLPPDVQTQRLTLTYSQGNLKLTPGPLN